MKYALTLLTVITASCPVVIGHKAPLTGASNPGAIADRYYISLRHDCTLDQHLQRIGVSRTDEYFNKIFDIPMVGAYGGQFPPGILDKIRSDECVRAVEHDIKVYYLSSDPGTNPSEQNSSNSTAQTTLVKRQPHDWTIDTQKDAPWNLDMVSEHEKKAPHQGGRGPFGGKYHYESTAGKGVDVYVVEGSFTLINPEYAGRASTMGPVEHFEPNFPGHSSCVASIIAGNRFGVAKQARLISVPPDVPTTGGILTRLNQIFIKHQMKARNKADGFRGSVLNLSIGAHQTFASQVVRDTIRIARHLDDCFTPENSQSYVPWEDAQNLYLRLTWERGHINQYDPYDPSGQNLRPGLAYGRPIPCHKNACVQLYFPREQDKKRVFIPDSIMLERYLLNIMTTCLDEPTGLPKSPLGGTTGGQMKFTALEPEVKGLWIRLGTPD